MRTTRELMDWIYTNACTEGTSDTMLLERACWFCAYQDAESFIDGARAKDIARLIRDGERIGGPYLTEADVQEFLDIYFQDVYEESTSVVTETARGELVENLIGSLKTHFGIEK